MTETQDAPQMVPGFTLSHLKSLLRNLPSAEEAEPLLITGWTEDIFVVLRRFPDIFQNRDASKVIAKFTSKLERMTSSKNPLMRWSGFVVWGELLKSCQQQMIEQHWQRWMLMLLDCFDMRHIQPSLQMGGGRTLRDEAAHGAAVFSNSPKDLSWARSIDCLGSLIGRCQCLIGVRSRMLEGTLSNFCKNFLRLLSQFQWISLEVTRSALLLLRQTIETLPSLWKNNTARIEYTLIGIGMNLPDKHIQMEAIRMLSLIPTTWKAKRNASLISSQPRDEGVDVVGGRHAAVDSTNEVWLQLVLRLIVAGHQILDHLLRDIPRDIGFDQSLISSKLKGPCLDVFAVMMGKHVMNVSEGLSPGGSSLSSSAEKQVATASKNTGVAMSAIHELFQHGPAGTSSSFDEFDALGSDYDGSNQLKEGQESPPPKESVLQTQRASGKLEQGLSLVMFALRHLLAKEYQAHCLLPALPIIQFICRLLSVDSNFLESIIENRNFHLLQQQLAEMAGVQDVKNSNIRGGKKSGPRTAERAELVLQIDRKRLLWLIKILPRLHVQCFGLFMTMIRASGSLLLPHSAVIAQLLLRALEQQQAHKQKMFERQIDKKGHTLCEESAEQRWELESAVYLTVESAVTYFGSCWSPSELAVPFLRHLNVEIERWFFSGAAGATFRQIQNVIGFADGKKSLESREIFGSKKKVKRRKLNQSSEALVGSEKRKIVGGTLAIEPADNYDLYGTMVEKSERSMIEAALRAGEATVLHCGKHISVAVRNQLDRNVVMALLPLTSGDHHQSENLERCLLLARAPRLRLALLRLLATTIVLGGVAGLPSILPFGQQIFQSLMTNDRNQEVVRFCALQLAMLQMSLRPTSRPLLALGPLENGSVASRAALAPLYASSVAEDRMEVSPHHIWIDGGLEEEEEEDTRDQSAVYEKKEIEEESLSQTDQMIDATSIGKKRSRLLSLAHVHPTTDCLSSEVSKHGASTLSQVSIPSGSLTLPAVIASETATSTQFTSSESPDDTTDIEIVDAAPDEEEEEGND